MEEALRNVSKKFAVGLSDFAVLELKSVLETYNFKSVSELGSDLQKLLPPELLSPPNQNPTSSESFIEGRTTCSGGGLSKEYKFLYDASFSQYDSDDDSWGEYSLQSSSSDFEDDDNDSSNVDLSGIELVDPELNQINDDSNEGSNADDDYETDDNVSHAGSTACGSSLSTSMQTSNLATTYRRKCCPNQNCRCSLWEKDRGCCDACRFHYGCQCFDCGKASSSGTEGQRVLVVNNLKDEADRYRGYDYSYIKSQIERCSLNTKNSCYWSFDWKIGRLDCAVKCCSKAFRTFYNFSKSTFNKVSKELKQKRLLLSEPMNKTPTADDVAAMAKFHECVLGYKLQTQMQSLLRGTHSLTWEASSAWFNRFVELHCNEEPNRRGERHFNKGYSKKQVYAEYKKELASRKDGVKSFSYASFCKMWKRGFPEVKCRKFQAGVQTKCVECAILEYEGNEAKTSTARYEVQMLHYFHGLKYKGQRQWYHNIREECIQCASFMTSPGGKVSMIGDGMAQVHNAIPSYGQSGTTIAKLFDTHFQGVITHGKRFTIYRTFGNCGKGSNVAIYAWLRELEKVYDENEKRLPDTLYFQIDGGSENANSTFIALAELLVHRCLTKKIVLTRLPPGHTHEDIDGKFAIIWVHNRKRFILTPQEQYEETIDAFRKEGVSNVSIEDIYVVPDYKKYFDAHSKIHCAFQPHKEKLRTQLQFIIERNELNAEFPLGVKTTYRAYATDKTYEIRHKTEVPLFDHSQIIGNLIPEELTIITRPTSEDNNGKHVFQIYRLISKYEHLTEFLNL
jgi:hypothetical protein